MVTSSTAAELMRELWESHDEVWVHFGDSDVVDYGTAEHGSVFQAFQSEILRPAARAVSRVGWCGLVAGLPTALMRSTRASAWMSTRMAMNRRRWAKFNWLLAEVESLAGEVMSGGRYPMALYKEGNIALNARHLEQMAPGLTQALANNFSQPDIAYSMQARMSDLGMVGGIPAARRARGHGLGPTPRRGWSRRRGAACSLKWRSAYSTMRSRPLPNPRRHDT